MQLSICAIFKNEAPYLREWIQFHRLVGVESIYLYQNRSEDDYESALHPFLDDGFVHLIDWPYEPPAQKQAYQHFITTHKGKPWWAAFLDCDEFLFSPCYSTITEALDAIVASDWGAIGVNWMCFGASGQEEFVPRPIIERFTLRPSDSFPPNRHIKTVARMDRIESIGADPHYFAVNGGTYLESGSPIFGPLSKIPSHSVLRINHYHTKSRQEFQRRLARGNADGTRPEPASAFEGYQAAEIDDRSIWRFLPALKERLEQLSPAKAPVQETPALRDYSRTTEPASLPRNFAAYRNFHQGQTILVCGCGTSLSTVVAPERFPTIGVNDVGRLFIPDYLVVVNPRSQFSGDRFRFVETSQAQAIFTQLDLGIQHPNIVRFKLGRRGGTEFSDFESLPYTRNSTYIALCLALYMGAKRIGLIGVDFTDHHFFAPTGRHSLAREVNQINNEYNGLAHTCQQLGVEVFNLSPESRVTAFPRMSPEQFARRSLIPASTAPVKGRKVFFVNYRFLSCGEVFSDGLRNAAEDLGMESASALWSDKNLPTAIDAFAPNLLFVVHGRKYTQRWNRNGNHQRSAVWLLDEPYEVDDTSRFSQRFDATFINDPSTLHRHKNSSYLPVCYDPAVYHYRPGPREHRVGFIGGANPAREATLRELARHDLLSYAVGGPWRSAELRNLTRALNIPAAETARLYQQTQIIVNIFRTAHHFNREGVAAVSINPRIYEALACGALVVSERRPEIEQLCPEMPVFDEPQELVALIQSLLAEPARFDSIRKACIRRLAGHTYAHRLYTAFTVATQMVEAPAWKASLPIIIPAAPLPTSAKQPATQVTPALPGWDVNPEAVSTDADVLLFRAQLPPSPGSETGLIGTESYSDVRLSFEIFLQPGSTVVAKIHQLEQRNQASNSYHLMMTETSGYIARHNFVFHTVRFEGGAWHKVELSWIHGTLKLEVDDKTEWESQEVLLPSGYCFLGIKAGAARILNLKLDSTEPAGPTAKPISNRNEPIELLYSSTSIMEPVVSIVTTVYDRTASLEACVRSVQALHFDRYEQIIVADSPPQSVLDELKSTSERHQDGRHLVRLASLRLRANDWGITPAAAGLSMAVGKYVCFLSDDNGYKPEHFGKLVAALEQDPRLGFAYSGCLYDGRSILNTAPPAYGRIDLGQPLFRRELFDIHLGGTLPFHGIAWDWEMIQRFLRAGVRWKHIGDTTFIFRLAKYPALAPSERHLNTQPFADTTPAPVN